MEDSDVTQVLLDKKVDLQKDYHKACRVEEEYWRQKSRSLWLQVGDKNTSYFHKQFEARKQYKNVSEIQFQDKLIKDFEGIKKASHHHFKDLYMGPTVNPIDASLYLFDTIPQLVQEGENMLLPAPISMKEVKKSLDLMEADKALEPDYFTTRF